MEEKFLRLGTSEMVRLLLPADPNKWLPILHQYPGENCDSETE